MRLPREIGPIHFVGIGGIGMSGIAEVLCNLGYTVQGSDASEGANVVRLREKGIKVTVADNTKIAIEGIDKQVVGQLAADIRAYYPPEPYKAKGVRYAGEQIRRKAGKSVK